MQSRTQRIVALVLAGAFVFTGPANAVVETYTATMVVDSVPPELSPGFEVGDRFLWTFTLDHDATDSDPDPGAGQFETSLGFESFTRDAGNAGTWDPSSGTLVPSQMRTRDNQGRDAIEPNPSNGGGFPTVGDWVFFEMVLVLEDLSQTAVDDTGTGQTLEEILGGATFDPASFPDNRLANFRFNSGFEFRVVTLSIEDVVRDEPTPVEVATWGRVKESFK